jgi:hypothetical protein
MSPALRAGAVGLVMAAMGILATPGLDFIPSNALGSERARALVEERGGATGLQVARWVDGFNRRARMPLVHLLEPIQKPFRIAQTWNLYRDGPSRVRRMEIQVDGDPVYRTGDPALQWLGPQLASRKMRPVLETTTRSRRSRNWKGLSRFVVEQARQAHPQAEKVEMLFLVGDFPGVRMEESHRIVAQAPLWLVRMP